ncbi:MAG: 3-deoxy-manno-octulosonate cytidylyltransferase [Elusimicrobia bacterium]|nr:3-deoxy-manno-octulosonate cytidylyltransferase [Elusimicrobiota bacterium]
MGKTVIVIPARYASQRFPGKVLYPLMGKTVLQWVWEAAVKSRCAQRVIIASEHKAVAEFAAKIGAEFKMTSASLKSGSDRVWKAAENINCDYVVNLQSDEPFISSNTLKKTIKFIENNNWADISTACSEIKNIKEIKDTNCVKIAMASNGRAFYFSREPIPHHHPLSPEYKIYPYYKHCGLYVYRKKALAAFVKAKPTHLEILERLEQLRALEMGLKIGVCIVPSLGPAIDTPADIKRAMSYYKKLRG